ncbi:hypothetical protein RvY_11828 [Ramazzottius varieornatus]|uniref:Uncharacterized protein n=1 Tax=Ramazzottius varieornatus TaxID=947166 RepID=A0A1D1VHH0_RAMVA|nr:hypothetical protein RvY_11828 [Ramazzottius varieornatus]
MRKKLHKFFKNVARSKNLPVYTLQGVFSLSRIQWTRKVKELSELAKTVMKTDAPVGLANLMKLLSCGGRLRQFGESARPGSRAEWSRVGE